MTWAARPHRRAPPGSAANEPGATAPALSELPGTPVEIIDDVVDGRVRKPVDLLRLLATCAALALLVSVGVLGRGTASGLQADVLGAGQRLAGPLLGPIGVASGIAVALLVCATAIDAIVRRQYGWLAEAILTGGAGMGLVMLANIALRTSAASHLTAALTTVSRGGLAHPLDAYLAGLVAYMTVLGASYRRWSTWLGLAVGIDVVDSVIHRNTTILAALIALACGYAVGLLVRYVAGIPTSRPVAADIARYLNAAGAAIRKLMRVSGVVGPRRYSAVTSRGQTLDVTVLDRDQEAAGALYRLYRWVRVRSQISEDAPLSIRRVLERQALMSYALPAAGVATPQLVVCVPVGSEAVALGFEGVEGSTLASRGAAATDDQLAAVWRTVEMLHTRRITHRALTTDRVLLLQDGTVALLEPGGGDIAASDMAIRLDQAQLLAEMGLLVGPERAASAALNQLGAERLARVVPLLQRVAMHRSTRSALRSHRHLLAALRERVLEEAGPLPEPEPVQLKRLRLRSVVSLVGGVVAAYVIIGQLSEVDLGSVLRSADWRWGALAGLLSVATYVAAALSLVGFVVEPLSFARTVVAQVAASFVTLVVPGGAGGVAVNTRYLQRSGVPAAGAVASVGVSQIAAFVLHIVLLVIFAAITGTTHRLELRPPTWVYYVLVALIAVAITVLLLPAGRRVLRARVAPTLSQVVPRLLKVAQSPGRLAEGVAGALALTVAYVLCLDACIRAVGGSISFPAVAVVYLTGSALGSAAPTPGGLGAVEAALSAGLTAAGLDSATAISAVLLFRLLTFWLPVPFGGLAYRALGRWGAL